MRYSRWLIFIILFIFSGIGISAVFAGPNAFIVTYTVTNTDDSGPGSLRQAIIDANANPGLDTIDFAIGSTGSQQTIILSSTLPTINDPVILDGWSQGGADYSGSPLIELNGENLNTGGDRGIRIDSGGSTIRGFVINRFDAINGSAVWLRRGDSNWVYGNYFGVSVDGNTPLPNYYGIWVDNWGNSEPSDDNIIGTNGDGVNDAYEGNVIAANVQEEIRVETIGNTISGNYIGTNAGGTFSLSSGGYGIILFEDNNQVGTDGDGLSDDLEGNVISGNVGGVSINNSSNHTIAGNIIGLDATGTVPLSNNGVGINCNASATPSENITIGSNNDGVSDKLEGNIISGNVNYGFSTFSNNCRHISISGNFIGTNISATTVISNGSDGIIIGQGDWYTITENIISGNSGDGINLGSGANNIIISDNIIGSDAGGTADLGNGAYGIRNDFGDNETFTNNLISGNENGGILSNGGVDVYITDNLIGVQSDGSSILSNESVGVYISGGANNTVYNNVIAYNHDDGVAINGNQAISHTISANSIFNNQELGIDLFPNGVTIPDPDDVDTGPNGLQNHPSVLSAINMVDQIIIGGALDSTANTTFTLEFFSNSSCDSSGYGEGQDYLGSYILTTDLNGDATYSAVLPILVPEGLYLTATATGAEGTSEFSACFGPTGPVQDNPITGLTAENNGPQLDNNPVILTATVATGSNVTYVWDPGDGSNPLIGQVVMHTYQVQGTYTAVVTATNNVSQQTMTTTITITRSASVSGKVWDDWDGDGKRGPGETPFPGEIVRVIQNGRNYTDTVSVAGGYLIRGLDAGTYTIFGPTPNGYRPFGAVIRVGSAPLTGISYRQDFSYQANFTGVQGRAWLDNDFDGHFNLDDSLLTGHPITLTADATGATFTTTTDMNGFFRIDLNTNDEETHTLQGLQPPLYEDIERTINYANMNGYASNLNYKPGAVGGCVSSPAGNATINGLTIVLRNNSGQQIATTTTNGSGCYLFTSNDAQGAASVSLYPAAGDLIVGPQSQPALYQGEPVRVDWQVSTPGEVQIGISGVDGFSVLNGQSTVSGYQVNLETISGILTQTTHINGIAYFDNVPPGRVTATVPLAGDKIGVWPASWRYDLPSGGSIISPGFSLGTYGITAECRTPAIPGHEPNGRFFSCAVDLYDFSQGTTLSWSLAEGEQFFYQPASSGFYRVTLTPNLSNGNLFAANDEFWFSSNDSHHFGYPYYLPDQLGPVSGEVWIDRNANGTRDLFPSEFEEPAIGFTVELVGDDGTIIESTVTDEYGRYNLYPPADGTFGVRLKPSSSILTTTPNYWTITRELDEIRSDFIVFGAAFLTGDILGRVSFDDASLSPASHVEVQLLDPADTSTPLEIAFTGPNGDFNFDPLLTGQYLVRVLPPNGGQPVERQFVMYSTGNTSLNIRLATAGNTPTVLAYIDNNRNGVPNPGEGIAGLAIRFDNQMCGLNSLEELITTNSDGLAPAGSVYSNGGCASIEGNLPDGLILAEPEGVTIAPYQNGIIPLKLMQTGSWLVRPFWDVSGEGIYDSGEPILLDDITIVSDDPLVSVTRLENGFEVFGTAGFVEITVNPPPGGAVPINQPFHILLYENGGGASTVIPIQFLGGVAGNLAGPTSSAVSGQTIELVDEGGSIVATTTTIVASTSQPGGRSYTPPPAASGGPVSASFQFENIAPGTYTVRLADVPPGTIYQGNIQVVHDPANPTNVLLRLTGNTILTGTIYWDNDYNGQRDSGEPGTNFYDVVLLNNTGSAAQTVTPAADGTFVFTGLEEDVQYALTVPDLYDDSGGAAGNWITQSPGWFTIGSQPVPQIGIGNFSDGNPSSLAVGQVYLQNGTSREPVPGATVGYYQLQTTSGFCNAINPTILGQTISDRSGYYRLPLTYIPGGSVQYCLIVLDAPGLVQNDLTVIADAAISFTLPGGMVIYDQALNLDMDIKMRVVQGPFLGQNEVVWAAFRDDNLNGFWDEDEFPLPSVQLGSGANSSSSQLDGSGLLLGLNNGENTLTITPPTGYMVVGPAVRTIWLTGSSLELPPLGFINGEMVSGVVFADKDGDGMLGSTGEEFGLGNLQVTLNGPVVTSTTTLANGHFTLKGLPDGDYTVTATVPTGYLAETASLTISNSTGLVKIAAEPLEHLSGAFYQDWDGDGLRLPDENLAIAAPITVTVPGIGSTLPLGGTVLFWDVAPGSYTINPLWDAVLPLDVTLGPANGGSFGLPVVPAEIIRGTVWFDENGDGIRQPWEMPIAGITITLDGGTIAITDENGRYQFAQVSAGSHTLNAQLPDGLTAEFPAVVTTSGRGAAVGIAVTPPSQQIWQIYLPYVSLPE